MPVSLRTCGFVTSICTSEYQGNQMMQQKLKGCIHEIPTTELIVDRRLPHDHPPDLEWRGAAKRSCEENNLGISRLLIKRRAEGKHQRLHVSTTTRSLRSALEDPIVPKPFKSCTVVRRVQVLGTVAVLERHDETSDQLHSNNRTIRTNTRRSRGSLSTRLNR